MKRSSRVTLTLAASVASLLTSCNNPDRIARRCVDDNNRVVEDRFCQDDAYRRQYPGFYPYHFYYGGPRGFIAPGAFVSGGSTVAPAGVTSFSSPTSRGVIGGAGEAHGAGGGEGAGE